MGMCKGRDRGTERFPNRVGGVWSLVPLEKREEKALNMKGRFKNNGGRKCSRPRKLLQL